MFHKRGTERNGDQDDYKEKMFFHIDIYLVIIHVAIITTIVLISNKNEDI